MIIETSVIVLENEFEPIMVIYLSFSIELVDC